MASRGQSSALRFAATCSRGTEDILAAELRRMGIHRVKEGPGVVTFMGGLQAGYRALLWSRVASRVLLQLSRFECRDAEDLYDGVRDIPWTDHLGAAQTLAVSFVGRSKEIRHSGFGALRTKDAIVDAVRDGEGARPDIDTEDPDLRVHVHLNHAVATVSLDLSGRPLHERGEPGRRAGPAPLKETLAAAMLLHAGWPRHARRAAALVDPMCGSGTLLVEAAGIALDRAANLDRQRWGFSGWRGHEAAAFEAEREGAVRRWEANREHKTRIVGFDQDGRVLSHARDNARSQGLLRAIRLERVPLGRAEPPRGAPDAPHGLLVTNPPYGERLGREDDLERLYGQLGDVLRRRFTGWTGWVLTGSRHLAGCIGLKAASRTPLWNGRIECRLLEYPVHAQAPQGRGPGWRG